MKKIFIIMIAAVMLAGCGEKNKLSDNETVNEQKIDGFEKAEYEKYNSPASENGLGGSLIYVDGTVNSKISVENVLAMIVVDENNNSWLVSLTDRPEEDGYIADELTGYDVRVFGEYQGYSSVYNMPAMAISIEDGRIDFLKNDGEYETVFEFYEYYKSREQENIPEAKVLSKETYYIEEDEFTFGITQNEDEYSLSVLCKINDKSDAFDTQIGFTSLTTDEDNNIREFMDKLDFSYTISVGDGTLIFYSKDASMIMSDDNKLLSFDEYYSDEWFDNEFRESTYKSEILKFLLDFIENN